MLVKICSHQPGFTIILRRFGSFQLPPSVIKMGHVSQYMCVHPYKLNHVYVHLNIPYIHMPPTHTHTHTHTHTNTHTHYIHAQMHMHTHYKTHTHSHACTHAPHTHTYRHKHTHTRCINLITSAHFHYLRFEATCSIQLLYISQWLVSQYITSFSTNITVVCMVYTLYKL